MKIYEIRKNRKNSFLKIIIFFNDHKISYGVYMNLYDLIGPVLSGTLGI